MFDKTKDRDDFPNLGRGTSLPPSQTTRPRSWGCFSLSCIFGASIPAAAYQQKIGWRRVYVEAQFCGMREKVGLDCSCLRKMQLPAGKKLLLSPGRAVLHSGIEIGAQR